MQKVKNFVGSGLTRFTFTEPYYSDGTLRPEVLQELVSSKDSLEDFDLRGFRLHEPEELWNFSISCSNLSSLSLAFNTNDQEEDLRELEIPEGLERK